jgi:hypothetical protein
VSKKVKGGLTLQSKREIAKNAASIALGAVALTGFAFRNRIARKAHVVLGVALIGLVALHHSLYPKSADNKKRLVS